MPGDLFNRPSVEHTLGVGSLYPPCCRWVRTPGHCPGHVLEAGCPSGDPLAAGPAGGFGPASLPTRACQRSSEWLTPQSRRFAFKPRERWGSKTAVAGSGSADVCTLRSAHRPECVEGFGVLHIAHCFQLRCPGHLPVDSGQVGVGRVEVAFTRPLVGTSMNNQRG